MKVCSSFARRWGGTLFRAGPPGPAKGPTWGRLPAAHHRASVAFCHRKHSIQRIEAHSIDNCLLLVALQLQGLPARKIHHRENPRQDIRSPLAERESAAEFLGSGLDAERLVDHVADGREIRNRATSD